MHPNDGRVVSNFIVQALQSKPITIYGDGQQTRSFCYVDDLIDGMVAAMNSDDSFVGPVNMGNPEEYSILELAEKIISMTGSNSQIIYKDLPLDDPKQRRPDIRLATDVLGWKPKTLLEDGLEKTISYFRALMG